MKPYYQKWVISLVLLIIFSCAPSLYDHYTFTETLATKVQADNLIIRSTEPYIEHRDAVDNLQQQIDKMVLYEQAKSKNPITVQMWKTLDANNSSLQQFLSVWEKQGTVSPAFVEEYQQQVDKIFQLMINYETKKSPESANALSKALQAL